MTSCPRGDRVINPSSQVHRASDSSCHAWSVKLAFIYEWGVGAGELVHLPCWHGWRNLLRFILFSLPDEQKKYMYDQLQEIPFTGV